ncbi:nucleoside recognition domain-containing protein [Methanothermococcus okinawensis]|uniref:nucleoside recognition domain-containing protein n=1 Tax=Methanothermococcus okinawensis TaxID=155863 RepID=UPI00064EC5EF|nr:nucleoside recognition domain-containing protein [Methanothermococcus okinawensis]
MNILHYLIQILFLSSVGIIIAGIIEETNIFFIIKKITKPLCLISNLPEECVLSLLGNFINPTVGKSMLAKYYKENKINSKETIITTIISPLPTILGESIFRIILPLAVAILGVKLGVIYVSIIVISGFLQALIGILYANLFFERKAVKINNNDDNYNSKTDIKLHLTVNDIINGFKKSLKILKKIIPMIIIFTFLMDILIKLGLMDVIGYIFTPIFKIFNLPGDAITVLIANIIHSSAGYATVDMLIKNGILNEKQALLTLLIGNIITTTMLYLKYTFGNYIALFGKFGIKLTIINYSVSLIIKILLIACVMLLMF